MATAHLKPRRTRNEERTNISVVLEQAPVSNDPQEKRKRVTFPWMQITDNMLELLGFRPDQHVMFSVDHRRGQINISLDRDHTIAGRRMTKQQLRLRNKARSD